MSEVDRFLEATIILKRWSCFKVNARGNFFGAESLEYIHPLL